ncbi:hypothetical protein GE061_010475 [Apolygus lucorum]|uniref:Uncharacterized protein n=1 Tax=Apolygus lucorum TaxID=248454 RepID=A0A8S9XXG1_APOLU|nr:hypothetical protein GE061_010475 [Apolygus lucorum]
MERIRAERTVARRIFSRACTALDQELKKEEVDYESACAKMRTMEYEAQKLFEIDEDMKVKLFAEKMDEEDQVKEFEDMSDFRSKFFLYSGKFETYVRLRKEASGSVDEQSVVSVYGQFDTKSKRNLKIDQMKYETDSHKSQYPFQSSVVGAKARKVLERFPPSGENYHEELSYRKDSVAKDDFLIRPYYRQLLNLVIQLVYSKTDISLSDIFDRLSAQLRALKHLGVTKEKYAATVEACLPVDVLKAWSRFRLTPAAATIGSEKTPDLMVANIIVFLKAEGESDERKRLSTNGLSSSEKEAEELQPISPKLFIQDIKSTKTDFDTLLSGDHGTGWDQHAESSTV